MKKPNTQIGCRGRIGSGFQNQGDNFAKVLKARMQPKTSTKPKVDLR